MNRCVVCKEEAVDKLLVYTSPIDGEEYYKSYCEKHLTILKEGKEDG